MKKLGTMLLLLGVTLGWAGVASAYDFSLADDLNLNVRGELSYTIKARTENPASADKWLPEGSGLASGDKNFDDKWDLVNNKAIGRFEFSLATTHLKLFGRGEGFYDQVYADDDKFSNETQKYAELNFEPLEYYLEGKYDTLTFRLGRQIVQWGESVAPIFAVAVNTVNPFYGQKVAAAGYTSRDYQVPELMAWASWEVVPSLSIEGVYEPSFEARYYYPVVGTFASFTDALGYGAFPKASYDDQRPTRFEDMQQYGGAVRKIFADLNNFELGLYYFHHLSRSPVLTLDFLAQQIKEEYPEMDMYGASFSQAIGIWDLDFQLNGEAAYRPNDVVKKDLIINNPLLASSMQLPVGTRLGPLGGYEEVKTLNWNIGGMKIFTDIFPFTPWTVSSSPLFEVYSGTNLDYDKEKNFSDPKNRYYYMVSLPFSTADMLDNATVTLGFDITGSLHQEQNSLHRFSETLKLKYGNNLETLVGYDFIIGIPKQDNGPNNMPDRDALTFKLTWYFI